MKIGLGSEPLLEHTDSFVRSCLRYPKEMLLQVLAKRKRKFLRIYNVSFVSQIYSAVSRHDPLGMISLAVASLCIESERKVEQKASLLFLCSGRRPCGFVRACS